EPRHEHTATDVRKKLPSICRIHWFSPESFCVSSLPHPAQRAWRRISEKSPPAHSRNAAALQDHSGSPQGRGMACCIPPPSLVRRGSRPEWCHRRRINCANSLYRPGGVMATRLSAWVQPLLASPPLAGAFGVSDRSRSSSRHPLEWGMVSTLLERV